MITVKNSFSGANFDYTSSENSCTASGEYRYENDQLVSININGSITKDDVAYNFWANRDAAGNVNISGVPVVVLAEVASEVAETISEIVGENASEE